MLTRLSIQGLAIIESLSIDFSDGFNVITGETGAGKSILIKALSLLLGGRAAPDTVRSGWDHAIVTGEFTLAPGHPSLDILTGLGIPFERDGDECFVYLRRQLTRGRSQSWVNDVAMTAQPLKEVGSHLVDVFAQHENQRLVDPSEHIGYLDAFLPDGKLVDVVKNAYAKGNLVLEQLHSRLTAFQTGDKHRDYLAFRFEELEKFGPSEEDYAKIKEKCARAESAAAFREVYVKALSLLEGGDSVPGAAELLKETAKVLNGHKRVATDEMQKLCEKLERAATEVEDVSFELGKRLSEADGDEEALEALQGRLFQYQDLFRKHGVKEISALMEERQRLKEQLEALDVSKDKLEELLSDLGKQAQGLLKTATELTDARRLASARVKKNIEKELHELAMPGARFDVEFSPVARVLPELDFSAFGEAMVSQWKKIAQELSRVGGLGAEKCQFFLATNPGENLLPLAKIASGGELSRIMLALKKSLAVDGDTCVLVFDEIDTGISGRVADVVGKKMRELSGKFQVLCISHLAQVAVYADTHFLVKKQGKQNRTESTIVRLTEKESAQEVARLLSGAEVSKPGLANAMALMQKARSGGKRITRSSKTRSD